MKPFSIRLPLLYDHHSHPLLYASLGKATDLQAIRDKSTAISLLQSQCSRSAEHELTLAYGWRSNLYSWPQTELDELGNVAIFNLSLHQLKLSSQAEVWLAERFGNDVANVSDPVWYESNFRTVLNWFAGLHANVESLQSFYDQLLTLGVYAAEELLLVDQQEIELFQHAGLIHRTRFWASPEGYDQLTEQARQQVAGLKLFTDGAIGARTAALNRVYLEHGLPSENQRGMLMYTDEVLRSTIDHCLKQKDELAIHAIGDRAIEQVIESLEQQNLSGKKIRLEHAQLIDRQWAERAKSLGLILSMQPNFSSDSTEYKDRLHQNYLTANNPFRMLIDEVGFVPGEDLIFGSDGMPHGIEEAARLCFRDGLPSQRLTPDEFVAGYTRADSSRGEIELEVAADRIRYRVNM